MESPPVVVVGAGPTGLAAACALLAGGVSVRVLERGAEPAGTSRALGLQPRGVEVLERLGALGDLPQRSLPIH
jgi:4,5-epoxidase